MADATAAEKELKQDTRHDNKEWASSNEAKEQAGEEENEEDEDDAAADVDEAKAKKDECNDNTLQKAERCEGASDWKRENRWAIRLTDSGDVEEGKEEVEQEEDEEEKKDLAEISIEDKDDVHRVAASTGVEDDTKVEEDDDRDWMSTFHKSSKAFICVWLSVAFDSASTLSGCDVDDCFLRPRWWCLR